MKILTIIFIGGGVGAVCRYATTKLFSYIYEGNFPIATFFINVLGSFLIGLFMAFFLKNPSKYDVEKALLITGFCGGFTTFSTFSLENITLIQKENVPIMLFYSLLSVFLGICFCYLGLKLGRS